MTAGALPAAAVLLLLAFLGGRLVPRRVPEFVGYLLVGAALGPTGLGLLTRNEFESLRPLTQIAMGVLLFMIGRRVSLGILREARRVAWLAVASYLAAGLGVFAATTAAGASLPLALMLGTLAGGGAPVTVAAIVRRERATGPDAERLIGLHMGVDTLVAIVFAVVLPLSSLAAGDRDSAAAVVATMARLGVAGLLVGAVLAVSLCRLLPRLSPRSQVVAAAAHALAAAAISTALGLSIPLSALVLGVVTAAVMPAGISSRVFGGVARSEPALYVLFFTLAGAAIRLDALPQIGLVGVLYIAVRGVAKFATGAAAGLLGGEGRVGAVRLGLDSLPQAGVAVGLAAVASAAIPGRGIATVTIGSILVFELVGAILVSEGLRRRRPLVPDLVGAG